MNEEFKHKVQSKLKLFNSWSEEKNISSFRLVQYSGVECLGGTNISESDVPQRISNLVSEGFCVDWNLNDDKCFLKVWEYENPEPEWNLVFLEKDLKNVSEILINAGFKPNA